MEDLQHGVTLPAAPAPCSDCRGPGGQDPAGPAGQVLGRLLPRKPCRVLRVCGPYGSRRCAGGAVPSLFPSISLAWESSSAAGRMGLSACRHRPMLPLSGLLTGDLLASLQKLALAKVSQPFAAIFVKGIFCNWLVCAAMALAASASTLPGRILGIFLPIAAFSSLGKQQRTQQQHQEAAPQPLHRVCRAVLGGGLEARMTFRSGTRARDPSRGLCLHANWGSSGEPCGVASNLAFRS